MSIDLVLILVIGVLVAAGVYLLLERSLSRILLGILMIGNGVNLLILSSSDRAGQPPLLGGAEEISDPLPQAMILTAIVITLGLVAFLLALAHRSWQLHEHDEVQDDVEDRRLIAALDDLEESDEIDWDYTGESENSYSRSSARVSVRRRALGKKPVAKPGERSQ